MHNRLFQTPQPNSTRDSKRRDRFSRHLAAIISKMFPTAPLAVCPARSLPSVQRSHKTPGAYAVAAVRYLLCLALLLGMVPMSMMPNKAYAAPNACDPSPSGLTDVIERATFCVYYDDAVTSLAEATTVADRNQEYWDLYISPAFGFLAPAFTDKLLIDIVNDSSCNGGTSASWNYYEINDGCFASSAESVQQTAGHELYHRVQYSYDGAESRWFKEGTARAMEDLAFTNIDQWPNSFMAPFSFDLQANEYINNSNVDITSVPQRYNSALWWKYFTEQFGATIAEPHRGVDAFLDLWEAAAVQNDIAALNAALGTLGAGLNFDSAFRRFAAAVYLKDLTNQPHATQFNFLDEDEVGGPGSYGSAIVTSGGTINSTTPVNNNDESISRYGTRYYSADPSATNCPVVSTSFHADFGPAFYHVVTQKGGAVDSFASTTAADFSRAFFNDGLTRIAGIVGSTDNAAQVDVGFECVTPVLNIVIPNSVAVANVGPAAAPGKFLVHVQVTNGLPTGPVVAGLTTNDFKAKVGTENALITAGGFIQEQYWLVVQAPVQAGGDGLHDLEITLESAGTTDVIASDSNAASISYNNQSVDHLLVLDRSGSMLSDGKMVAARNAAKFYVDITRNEDGVAVIPYNENVNPAPYTLREVTTVPNVRQEAKDYINGINASGLTSIGDGMREAVNERNATPTTNPVCSFVLLSDGMENSAEFWADVEDDAVDTGCPVTSIALGGATDETLMQDIATATGGLFFYNDVFVSAASAGTDAPDAVDAAQDTALDLGNVYEYAQAGAEKRQRVLAEKDIFDLQKTVVQSHTVMIDEFMTEAIFALDWVPLVSLKLTLIKPDGTVFAARPYDFFDFQAGHVGWRIGPPDLVPGLWTMVVERQPTIIGMAAEGDAVSAEASAASVASIEGADSPDQSSQVHYQVLVSGPSLLSTHLLLPVTLGTRYVTGQKVPIYALISSSAPISGVLPYAEVTPPSGIPLMVPLFDDGGHGDGVAGDGLYAGLYTAVNQALPIPPEGETPGTPTVPIDEGSYRVKLIVDGGSFQREALGSFSVVEGADGDGDGVPDTFEEDAADPDLDTLSNGDEYLLGTDPNHSDTDGGGEHDGSEYNNGKDPFDPADDEIVAPEFLVATADIGQNVISYDVKPEYVQMLLYRGTAPSGPWSLRSSELPNTGVYSDTADNGTTYYYRYVGKDVDNFFSEVIGTTPATPSVDPFPPEAAVMIDDGAPTTTDLNVLLSFVPSSEDVELFADITEMKLSNDPLLVGAAYQPFAQDVPWVLPPTTPGELAKVYAQFKDAIGNESLIAIGAIQVESAPEPTLDTDLFLPSLGK